VNSQPPATTKPAPTPEQISAARAEGDLLVVAGAGTGKTTTLVDRCLHHLLRPEDPVPLDAILMVTFTEAAAAEMRQRLRAALEGRLAANPRQPHLVEQLAHIDVARISTIHGFCLRLIRDHFHELGWDPELTVLSSEQAQLLANEVLETTLQRHLATSTELTEDLQSLILHYTRGQDFLVRELILDLHHYTQTLAHPAAWLDTQLALFAQPEPQAWLAWLQDGFLQWRDLWLPELDRQPPASTNPAQCAAILRRCPTHPSRTQIAHSRH